MTKSGKYHFTTPFAYCVGDPINFIDPNGEEVRCLDNDIFVNLVSFLYEDDGKINVFTHGTPTYMNYNKVGQNPQGKITSVEDFIDAINDNFTSINDIRNEIGVEVVLHSCRTGYKSRQGKKSIAQTLSEKLPHLFITAPSGYLSMSTDTKEESIYLYNKKHEKVFSDESRWRTFFRGYEITSSQLIIVKILLLYKQNSALDKTIDAILNQWFPIDSLDD